MLPKHVWFYAPQLCKVSVGAVNTSGNDILLYYPQIPIPQETF